MPQTQKSLSVILKDKLEEYTLLTDKIALNSCIKQICEIIESHYDELTLNDLWLSKNNIPSLFWLICSTQDSAKVAFKIIKRFGKQIPIEALLSAPSVKKEKSALLLLSAAAFQDATLHFESILHLFHQQIPLEALLTGPEEPCKEQSIFWHLCLAASKGDAVALFELWQQYGQQIPLKSLLATPSKGPNTGISALYALSMCPYTTNVLLNIWQRFGQQIPLNILFTSPEQDFLRKASLLYWLCNAASMGRPEVFMDVWQRFNQQIPLEALLIAPENGFHKGKSALLRLSLGVFKDKPEAFMAVWQKFNQQIPLEALLASPQDGPDKGASALWFLAAACKSNPEPFMAVWQRFGQEIPFDALFTRSDCNIIEAVSLGATCGRQEAFLAIWQRFSQHISITHLLTNQSKRQSILWKLSAAAGNGYQESFLAVWQRYGQQIPLEELLIEHKGNQEGETALWWLCDSTFGNEAFLAIWNRFNRQLSLNHMLVAPQEGPNKGKFGLWFMCRSNLKDELWKTLLQQNPGIITKEQINFKCENICVKDKFKALKLLPLINARNRFFKLLNTSEPQSKMWIQSIFEEAKKATAAGYCNAFYDLGKFLSRNSQNETALNAYKLVPTTSMHYTEVALKLCEEYFALALIGFDNQTNKMRHLYDSLSNALQTNDEIREMLIQRIACIYIQGTKEVGDTKLVPQEWIEAMHSGTSVDWCINRFYEIKERTHLSENLLIKTRELESLKAEYDLNQKTLRYLLVRMEALKSKNEKQKKRKTEVSADNQNPVIEGQSNDDKGLVKIELAHFDIPEEGTNQLRDSLQCALKLPDDERVIMIQRIARVYIEGNKEVSDKDWVSPEWLQAMNSDTSVEWCMNRLQEIKERKQLADKLVSKTRELEVAKAKCHESQSAIKQMLEQIELLENENQELKRLKLTIEEQSSRTDPTHEMSLIFSNKSRRR